MKNTSFVIVGGDKRQKYLKDYLNEQGFSAESYGLYDWDEDSERLKALITPKSVIILPLPVSKTGKTVFMPFSKKEVPLMRIANLISSSNTLLGGMLPKDFKETLNNKNITYYDFYDEDFVAQNAYLTAFGALKIILEHIDFALPLGKFAITGYGRVGQEMAKVLKSLSCDVTVFARSETALNKAELYGCKANKLYRLIGNADEFDIIINTIPCNIIDEDVLKNVKDTCKIIELASAPFGVNEKEAEKYSVNVIKAPGLPGKYTAKTAGELIAKRIIEFLQKEENG